MKWLEPRIYHAEAEIHEAFSSSFLLGGQLARRGITTLKEAKAFLSPEAYHPTSPFAFSELEKAVARLQQALNDDELIGIWGDFDVDGQTSTALLLSALRAIGARVVYHLPVRADESHGINLDFLKRFLTEGIQLLITCDTGITEFESLAYLKKLGVDVILTDHHTPANSLPPALAILNPSILPSESPLSHLSGVGTAFQLIRGLFDKTANQGMENEYLDLVALGTIADLANLTRENRYYAQLGLNSINQSPRPSLEALLDLAGFKHRRVTESHISYILAPRMNALGRLGDANPLVEFLLSTNEDFIKKTALHLEELNSRRKLAVEMVYRSALDLLDRDPTINQYPVILLAKTGWESGVVGIAASKLVEQFHKPVILMNIDDEIAAGSARSVEGINIIQAIQENANLLIRFGGHPMAAGLSLNVLDLPRFREALSSSIDAQTAGAELEPSLEIDAYLTFSSLKAELIDEIDRLAPFGPGNPAPLFVTRGVEIENHNLIGKSREHRRLTLKDEHAFKTQALWWNSSDLPLPEGLFDLAYHARFNEYKENNDIILEWVDFRAVKQQEISISLPISRFRIFDYRFDPNAAALLQTMADKPDILLWAEGDRHHAPSALARHELTQALKLAILTPPPSSQVLQQALEMVKPTEVLLFSLPSPDDSLKGFLNALAAVLRKQPAGGENNFSLKALGGMLGHTTEAIILGIEWWHQHGDIIFTIYDDKVSVEKFRGQQSMELKRHTSYLNELLIETSAFRNYYLRAEPYILLG